MTLAFSTHLDGSPTFFVQKIWTSLSHHWPRADDWNKQRSVYWKQHREKFGVDWDGSKRYQNPKLHTIRHPWKKKDGSGSSERQWKAGNDIHFTINNRTPKMFRFAPVVKCKSTQRIDIVWENGLAVKSDDCVYLYHDWFLQKTAYVEIDGRKLQTDEAYMLFRNDGFDNPVAFFTYFKDGIQDGRLIHWTDVRY